MTTENDTNKNMQLWNSVCKTNPNHTKEVKFGRKFTAIDAYSQIEAATEQWGPYGSDWGLYDIEYTHLHEYKVCDFKAKMRYSQGGIERHFPINTCIETHKNVKGALVFDTDYAKKAVTDMITKSLSLLGFNADVFMGKFDDNRYVNDMNNEFNPLFQAPNPAPQSAPALASRTQPTDKKPDLKLAQAIERLSSEIFCIKKAIVENDQKSLKEYWDEISEVDQRLLWTKERDFGPFSDVQRHKIQQIRDPKPKTLIANTPATYPIILNGKPNPPPQ